MEGESGVIDEVIEALPEIIEDEREVGADDADNYFATMAAILAYNSDRTVAIEDPFQTVEVLPPAAPFSKLLVAKAA
eukprot:11855141-Alexandrium_andersonii.AAC.1